MLDNTLSQQSTFKIKNWLEVTDDSQGTDNTNSQMKFKTSMLKSSLCDYSDAYIFVNTTITVANTAGAGNAANNTEKK